MSHTNSTTNYSLPQFLSSDKPFWLTDVNQAYVAIDTGMKNAQDTADAASTAATSAGSDATAALTAAATADSKGSGAVASIADTFSDVSTYAVGDLVIYNNLLYVCTVDVITPGPWTGAANWDRTTLASIDSDLITKVNKKPENSGSNTLFKLIVTNAITKTATANAGVAFTGDEFTVAIPAGYTPLVMTNVYCSNGAWALNWYDVRNIGSTAITLKFRNISTTDQQATVNMNLLCIRSDLIS